MHNFLLYRMQQFCCGVLILSSSSSLHSFLCSYFILSPNKIRQCWHIFCANHKIWHLLSIHAVLISLLHFSVDAVAEIGLVVDWQMVFTKTCLNEGKHQIRRWEVLYEHTTSLSEPASWNDFCLVRGCKIS